MTVKKAYRAANEVVLILSQYNFFILYLLNKQNESRCFIKTEAECVNESLRHEILTQIYMFEMISKPIQTASMTVADISDLCAHTRSELVQ
jgi:hypothetical protein